MNKFIFVVLLGVFQTISADLFVEVRSSAFFHLPDRFQKVYGTTGWTVGGEVSKSFSDNWLGFVDVDYFKACKNGTCFCDSTLKVVNTSFGLTYKRCLCAKLEGYIGIGPAISYVDLKNQICCGEEHFSRSAAGGVLKTGILVSYCRVNFIDIFIDYLYQPLFIERQVNIGGIKVGAGYVRKF